MTSQREIERYMTPTPITIEPELSLEDARERMQSMAIRHLPVVSDGNVIGILSDRDIFSAEAKTRKSIAKLRVQDSMHTVFTCEPEAPIENVLEEMHDERLGSVLVVKDGSPVGIFTSVNAVALLAKCFRDGTLPERFQQVREQPQLVEGGPARQDLRTTRHSRRHGYLTRPAAGFGQQK